MKIRKVIFIFSFILLSSALFADEQSDAFENSYICDCIGNEDNSLYLMRTIYEPDWHMAIYAFVNGRYNSDLTMHLLWNKSSSSTSLRGLVFSPYSKNFYFTCCWNDDKNVEEETTGLWRVTQTKKNDPEALHLTHEFIPQGISYLIVNKKGVWLLQDQAHFDIGEPWTNSVLYQVEDEKGKYLFKKVDSTLDLPFHSFFLFEDHKDQFITQPDLKYEMNINFEGTDYSLLICDKDEKSWWLYNCISDEAKKYENHELAYKAALAIDQTQEAQLLKSMNPKRPAEIVLQLLAMTCFFVIVIFILLIILQKKKQSRRAATSLIEHNKMIFDIQEKERAKISRDIHDSVVQDIRVLRLETENLIVDEASKARQTKIEDIATDCIIKLRNICYNLTPAELAIHNDGDSSKLELVSIINSLVQQFSTRTHIPCAFKVEEGFEYPVLEKEVTQNLFRVIQEALTNIEKHSYATQTSIFMKKENEVLYIYVTDDGIGMDTEHLNFANDSHLGLRNMKERMELIGGQIEFFSKPNEGLEITLSLSC